jgi:hypothetical protein
MNNSVIRVVRFQVGRSCGVVLCVSFVSYASVPWIGCFYEAEIL